MTTINAKNLTLAEVHRLLKIEKLPNGSFSPLLSLEPQSIWGLVTNGELYQFVYIQQENPPTYQQMPIFSLMDADSSIQLLQVLKAICKL